MLLPRTRSCPRRLAIGIIPDYSSRIPDDNQGELSMVRKLVRTIVLAGALALPLPLSAQVLELGVDQSPSAGLDPHIATAFATFQTIVGPIYEGLTWLDKDLRVIPSLAESWTISPDGKTY